MGVLDLTAFAALSFDCYGTLIDWERGIETALRPWLERHGCAPDRNRLLALFAASESRRQRAAPEAPYPEILAGCFEDIAAGLALPADSHQSSRRFSINVATGSHQSSHPILSMVATPERSDAITLLSAVLLSRFPRQRYHRRRPCCKVEGHGVRAARAPHESERRARTMLSHHPSRFSDAPERSDDSTARSAAPCRDHALVPAPASSLRMDLPRSSMRMAPWTRRSRMASARVASLSCRCQSATGN